MGFVAPQKNVRLNSQSRLSRCVQRGYEGLIATRRKFSVRQHGTCTALPLELLAEIADPIIRACVRASSCVLQLTVAPMAVAARHASYSWHSWLDCRRRTPISCHHTQARSRE